MISCISPLFPAQNLTRVSSSSRREMFEIDQNRLEKFADGFKDPSIAMELCIFFDELSTNADDQFLNVNDELWIRGCSLVLQLLDECWVDFTERYLIFLEQTDETNQIGHKLRKRAVRWCGFELDHCLLIVLFLSESLNKRSLFLNYRNRSIHLLDSESRIAGTYSWSLNTLLDGQMSVHSIPIGWSLIDIGQPEPWRSQGEMAFLQDSLDRNHCGRIRRKHRWRRRSYRYFRTFAREPCRSWFSAITKKIHRPNVRSCLDTDMLERRNPLRSSVSTNTQTVTLEDTRTATITFVNSNLIEENRLYYVRRSGGSVSIASKEISAATGTESSSLGWGRVGLGGSTDWGRLTGWGGMDSSFSW